MSRLEDVLQLARDVFGDNRGAMDCLEFVAAELALRAAADAKVFALPVVTTLDIPGERVLQFATDCQLTGAVVMGYRPDGRMFFASSLADGGNVLWLMAKCQHALVTGEPLQ